MKILLTYHFEGNFTMVGMEPLGLIQLGRVLKDKGHKVRYAPMEDKALGKAVSELSPELIGFSMASVHHRRALRLVKSLKQGYSFHSVFGGPHPTFFPEIVLEDGVDAVCIGEGDTSFPDYVTRLEAGDGHEKVPNMWVKAKGEIIKNDPLPLEQDLDVFPWPDREGLYEDRWLRGYRMKTFIASRGCPFSCTYCYNRLYREIYKGCGKVWRTRSAEHVVGEIEDVKKRWPLDQLTFVDDMFIPSDEWLEKFTELYRSRIGLPFTCFLRLDRINDERSALLAEAGCCWAFAAIESGDERIRREVLGRKMSDDDIVAGAESLHRKGIKLFTQNMMGVPGEGIEEAMKTLELNVRVKTDLAITSLFAPFPRLELTERAIEEGYYSGDPAGLPHNMTSTSMLDLPDRDKIERLQKLLPVLADIKWLRERAGLLVGLPLGPVYSWLRNGWMSAKVYRELQFRPTLYEHVQMVWRGLKYILWDR